MPTINRTPVVPKHPKRRPKEMPEDQYENWKLYNSTRWKKMRQSKLMEQPLCEICRSRGFITPAVAVHHDYEISNGQDELERQDIAFDYNNLVSICQTCHNRIHNIRHHGAHTREDMEFLEDYNKYINERNKRIV